jgi:hypothetical protein
MKSIITLAAGIFLTTVVTGVAAGNPRCETTKKSPGADNVALAAKELRDKRGSCGNDKDKVQMVHRGEFRIFK